MKNYRFIMVDGSRYTVRDVPYADVASFLASCAVDAHKKTFIVIDKAMLNLDNVVSIEEVY